MTKNAGIAALSAMLLLATAACDAEVREQQAAEEQAAAQGPPAPTDVPTACEVEGEPVEIGLVTINLQALFFNQIITGAQRVADEAGADLQVVNGDDDSVTQANAINDLVASGVDAVVVDAVDTEGIRPAVRGADAAGVPVVAVDATVDDPAVSTQVGVENAEGGAQIGEHLLEESGGEGTVHVVSALNSTVQLERQEGFTEAVEDGGMAAGTVVDGRNIQEDAQTAAENLLTGDPDTEYVYATGEPALIGLAAAVRGQNAADRVTVVGWDMSEPAVDGLREGWISGVVQQNTFEFGYASMASAIRLACGEEAPEDIPVPIQIVTPDNVEDYLYYLEK
ncbi:ribose transport system substrate-binding protein [Spinactinospora alkalitolerans]|uniref:Ribose transport system substrate-binding protein n=1 Tax=Spinactinospora alkalitolerans TaxID=687207 RepID=A0A852TT79_9ACTN|nr:substrate-binding domain-containing protein [Spinactinospora alkalitolerans]NYE46062.1 ribose transport system substrate-binding protein [Spinactinospora alkalitolerans]